MNKLTKTNRIKTAVLGLTVFAILFAATPVAAQEGVVLEVEQRVRNVTQGQTDWKDSTGAEPGDRVRFQITVQSTGSRDANNVYARATVPEGLAYIGNVRVGGTSVSVDIIEESLSLGMIPAGTSKTITFDARVAEREEFESGTHRLIATAVAFNAAIADATSAAVRIGFDGKTPTDVSTAAFGFSPLMTSLLTTLGLLLLGSYVYFARYYVLNHIVQTPYETRTERKLAAMREEAKKREQGK